MNVCDLLGQRQSGRSNCIWTPHPRQRLSGWSYSVNHLFQWFVRDIWVEQLGQAPLTVCPLAGWSSVLLFIISSETSLIGWSNIVQFPYCAPLWHCTMGRLLSETSLWWSIKAAVKLAPLWAPLLCKLRDFFLWVEQLRQRWNWLLSDTVMAVIRDF